MDYVAITRNILVLHKYVTFVEDVVFVNNITFLITMSRGIKFVKVENTPSRTDMQLSEKIKIVMKFYSRDSMIVINHFNGYEIRLYQGRVNG